MRSIFRVLLGLILACLVAGLVQASFIITPSDLARLGGDALTDRLQGLGILALLAAAQSAVFVGPAALLAIWIAEQRRIGSALFYVPLGVFLGGAGFLMQRLRGGAAATGGDIYALAAYAAAGFAAGLVYWRVAGRSARLRSGS